MFVVGLFLGPALALAGEGLAVGHAGTSRRLATTVIAALFAVLLVAPIASLEFRLGMVLGGLLGLLLASTPFAATGDEG